jgi:hypothetical protein
LFAASGRAVLLLAAAGLLWSLVRARWFGITLALWAGLMLLAANPGNLNLPGSSLINGLAVEIVLFIPLAVLGGYLLSELVGLVTPLLSARGRAIFYAALIVVAIPLAFLGAQRLLPILVPQTNLFRQADRPALEWASANLPEDAEILVNPFLWGYGIYAGQDGGYWLAPLAARRSLPPPALYGLWGDAERVRRISQEVFARAKDAPGLHALLQAEGIRYIFIGARGGVISPQALRLSPLFRQIYARDGAWIFEALP